MTESQQRDSGRDASDKISSDSAGAATALPEGFLEAMAVTYTGDARWKTVRRYFKIEAVRGNRDLLPDTLYLVHAAESHLIRSDAQQPDLSAMEMTAVESGQRMKPIARGMLVKMGQNGQLWRLSPKEASAAALSSAASEEMDPSLRGGKARLVRSVDLSAFSNLLAAARQSQLVPGLDQIAHVRDCEFRDGRFDQAFGIIERLFVAFRQSAEQRQQRLADEELQYRSGVVKMSPKEWQLKKQRDTVQTQVVERTRRGFTRVLDGLRGLTLDEEASGGGEDVECD
ncbi:MAG TPA: hypothetical protein DD670_21325 [Planctomycetaceae bacterium]|nr:hypothetical protein [Planctomycetaceae bacterium]